MDIENLYKWGKIKGINIIGTGDFTHPAWIAELQEKLEPAEEGLFTLKKSIAQEIDKTLPQTIKNNLIRFILTVEISNIYKKNDRVRKLHNVIIVPCFEAATRLNSHLATIGNLKADGRPILGMDSKDLLKATLECDPEALFIPAHIWTPWFAMFGSKSGFNSIEEAFDELASKIVAVETGLSSDPYMNWRLSQLDGITLVSHSDAHSPPKLGREANIIKSKVDYGDIIGAIKTNDERFIGTIEFFPEEGKYHYDGHRSCKISMRPAETKRHNGICPKCGKPLIVGVDYRVDELADRTENYKPKSHKKVEYIVPLTEVIAELEGVKSTSSKRVQEKYVELYSTLGDEFSILRKMDLGIVTEAGFERLSLALTKMRKGDVYVEPGYDGVYGVITIFGPEAPQSLSGQRAFGF